MIASDCVESEERNPLYANLREFSIIIEKACVRRNDDRDNGLCIIPAFAKTATESMIEFVLKIGLFTKGRRREVVVLASLKMVLASLTYEDLIRRARLRFDLEITKSQLANAVQDIAILKRDYKTERFGRSRLTSDDMKILMWIRGSKHLEK